MSSSPYPGGRASFRLRPNSLVTRYVDVAVTAGRIKSPPEPARLSGPSPGLEAGLPGYG